MKPLRIPILIALAGIAILTLLYPRFDPAAKLRAQLDRNQAIAKTRQLAAAKGVDTTGWTVAAAESLDSPTGPLKLQVTLIPPRSSRTVEAAWFPDGRLASSRVEGAPAAPAPKVQVETEQGTGKVTVRMGDDAPPREKLAYAGVRIVEGLWRVAVFIYFCVAAIRRRIHYRVALTLTLVLAVWVTASYWAGTSHQKSVMRNVGDIGTFDDSGPSPGGAVFLLFVYAALGYSLRSSENREKWQSVELISRGNFFNRRSGYSVAAGLLCGVGIAALPYLVAATGLTRSSMIFRSADLLAAPFTTLAAWDLSAAVMAVGLFGFSLPLLAKVRRPALRWGLIVCLGVCVVGQHVTPFASQAANLVTGVLVFGAYLLLYLRADLLCAMAAMVAAQAALAPFLLLTQAGGSVRAMAAPLLLVWAVALAASLHSAIRGREGDELPAAPSLDPVEERETKTGRMRLEAEFDVARKAQEGALPAAAPAIEGFTLAGSCQPAQQVGGDLYDYFRLADGRLAIAVADVSGKGVPAALYMMVTKGLLAATTRASDDLAYILQQINQHLYRACRKKVFVTLAAVALDPVRRRLQHGRAGHNPIVWRRVSRGETLLLKPAGLALGMTPGDRFNRLLKIEEVELQSGDAVVLYSDGITEAVDATMAQYGEERLIRAVERTDGQAADESRVSILRDLAAFVGATPARDDITLVVLRVSENSVLT